MFDCRVRRFITVNVGRVGNCETASGPSLCAGTSVLLRRFAASCRLGRQLRKTAAKVLDKILGVLETDVQPHQVRGWCGRNGSMRPNGKGEAFVTAPAEADTEQLELIDETAGIALELEGKQAGRAFEVTLPEFVAGTVWEVQGEARRPTADCPLSQCAI